MSYVPVKAPFHGSSLSWIGLQRKQVLLLEVEQLGGSHFKLETDSMLLEWDG